MLHLAPLLSAPAVIQIHVVAALASVMLLVPIAVLRKGTVLHSRTGWIWIICMLVVATSSFAITRSGSFSAIHVLSVISLVSITMGVNQRRRGRITSHKSFMIGAAAGLVGAGLFTLLPGRMMSAVVFGPVN